VSLKRGGKAFGGKALGVNRQTLRKRTVQDPLQNKRKLSGSSEVYPMYCHLSLRERICKQSPGYREEREKETGQPSPDFHKESGSPMTERERSRPQDKNEKAEQQLGNHWIIRSGKKAEVST